MFTGGIVAGTTNLARRHTLLWVCALAACAAPAEPPKPPPPPVAVEAPPPPPVIVHRRPPPLPAHKPSPPEEEATASVEPPPPPPPAHAQSVRPPREGELIGLDQRGASRLFGTAGERAEKGPATIWRYKTDSCELDLYFYLDLKSGRMRTLHYAFKGETDDAAKRQECLRTIVDRSRQGPEPADAASSHR